MNYRSIDGAMMMGELRYVQRSKVPFISSKDEIMEDGEDVVVLSLLFRSNHG